jgi:hypothetical protein
MDGHPGSLVDSGADMSVYTLVDDRMYVLASWRPGSEFDSRRLVGAFLSTMHLLPGGPATPAPS